MRVPEFIKRMLEKEKTDKAESYAPSDELIDLCQTFEENHNKNIVKTALLVDRMEQLERLQEQLLKETHESAET